MSPDDEGMIHAWLDGALSASEAARIEQLVASDPAWAAAAADARGLIAASSRILSSLDAVPAQVVPAAMPTVSSAREQLRSAKVEPTVAPRRWRAQSWALAATLVMAVGAGVLWNNTPEEMRAPVTATLPTNPAPSASSVAGNASAADRVKKSERPAAVAVPEAARNAPQVAAGLIARARAEEKRANDVASPRAADAMATRSAEVAVVPTAPAAPSVGASAEPARTAASGAGAAQPSVAAPPTAFAAADPRAENAVKARRDMALDEASATGGASKLARAASAAPAALACFTVRTDAWSPAPSFPVPVGALLDSTRAGAAQVARALVGNNAPSSAPGSWTVAGDTVRVVIDRVVLGYTFTATLLRSTRQGTATLGDAQSPTKATTPATLVPSRCPAP